jgi:hypothetical protein
MESSPSSRLSFFSETGTLLEHPVEGQRCEIGINVPRELWPFLSLTLDAKPLPLRLDDLALAYAEWPACPPGHYELSLICDDINEIRTIAVMPQYFSENDLQYIVYDLSQRLPNFIAAALQESGGLSGINLKLPTEPSIEMEFARLNRAVNGTKDKLGILQLLPIIQRECHQILVPRNELKKANQTRKPDISKLPQAMAMAGNLYSNGALKQMYDVTVERSFETYENRLVKAYVQALQSQMLRLQSRMEAVKPKHALAKELETLLSEFRLACTRAQFLREVRQPFESAGRVTMVLLKNEAYRAIFEGYLSLYKVSAIRLAEPALNNPLSAFPYLYVRWVNLTVISVLLQICLELGYKCVSHPWIKQDHQGLFIPVMSEGEAGVKLSCPRTKNVVSIFSWKSAIKKNATAPGVKGQAPALAVAIYHEEKLPIVLLFDPKYAVSTGKAVEPLKEDVEELLHGMEQSMTPDGVREIRYAALLYPGLRKQLAPDLEALTARPANEEALRKSVYKVLKKYLG